MHNTLHRALIFLATLFLATANAQAADYKLQTLDNEKSATTGKPIRVKYQVNDFYSVYYTYMNVIRALGVEKHLSGNEIKQVVHGIIDQLKKQKAVQLTVSGYPGDEDLRVTVRTDYAKNDKKPILWVISNYDPRTKSVVTGKAQENAYATYFYLVDTKLVKYQYVTEAKSKKEKAANNLADFYLLDEEKNNDASGKALLIKEINETKVSLERFLMHLTLSEYYLLENNTGKAREALDTARKMIKTERDKNTKRTMTNIFPYADDIYTYYVSYRKS